MGQNRVVGQKLEKRKRKVQVFSGTVAGCTTGPDSHVSISLWHQQTLHMQIFWLGETDFDQAADYY